jgi:hypothetical protein
VRTTPYYDILVECVHLLRTPSIYSPPFHRISTDLHPSDVLHLASSHISSLPSTRLADVLHLLTSIPSDLLPPIFSPRRCPPSTRTCTSAPPSFGTSPSSLRSYSSTRTRAPCSPPPSTSYSSSTHLSAPSAVKYPTASRTEGLLPPQRDVLLLTPICLNRLNRGRQTWMRELLVRRKWRTSRTSRASVAGAAATLTPDQFEKPSEGYTWLGGGVP